ncbi:MAG: 3D domain-containing protein [Bryobacteraceae bacterium]
MKRRCLLTALAGLLPFKAFAHVRRAVLHRFTATAYALRGISASGKPARTGMVAADPRVLPLGSRIRIHNLGRYSGEYLVGDTGGMIKGNRIDIFVESYDEAVQFGRQRVHVEILASPAS